MASPGAPGFKAGGWLASWQAVVQVQLPCRCPHVCVGVGRWRRWGWVDAYYIGSSLWFVVSTSQAGCCSRARCRAVYHALVFVDVYACGCLQAEVLSGRVLLLLVLVLRRVQLLKELGW